MTDAQSKGKESRFDVIADPVVRGAVSDFYRRFYDPEKLIRWWAGLYDPDLGGFYYSNSARDTEGYLPDMESTYQILWRLHDFIPDLADYFGTKITGKIVSFYQTKQDRGDGYFYHPQWTKEESRKNVMRYTRDQDWAVFVLDWLHSAPLYPTALDRAADVAAQKSGGEQRYGVSRYSKGWLPNRESVTEYVKALLADTSCEHWSNQLDTQATIFRAGGIIDAVIDVLDATINPAYGLWVSGYDAARDLYCNMMTVPETEVPYGIYTNAYKVAKTYNFAGRLIPYALKMVENGIKAICSRDPGIRVTYLFNPWATLGNVRENLVNYGTPEMVAAYDALIRENIVEMLDALASSLGKYRWADGSYSYLQSGSKETIYDTPVSPGAEEGDVNGNNLVVLFATHICKAVGLSEMIPIFNQNHATLMLDLMKNAPKIQKAKN